MKTIPVPVLEAAVLDRFVSPSVSLADAAEDSATLSESDPGRCWGETESRGDGVGGGGRSRGEEESGGQGVGGRRRRGRGEEKESRGQGVGGRRSRGDKESRGEGVEGRRSRGDKESGREGVEGRRSRGDKESGGEGVSLVDKLSFRQIFQQVINTQVNCSTFIKFCH